jgi:hypothetical protein
MSNKSQQLWTEKDGNWKFPVKEDNMMETNMVLFY